MKRRGRMGLLWVLASALLVAGLSAIAAPPPAAGPAPAAASTAAAASPTAGPASPPQAPVADAEAARLREALRQAVPGLVVDTPQTEQLWVALTQAELAATRQQITRPELLVVVDRNPRVQQMRILLARPDGPWQSLGGAKVSTGRPGGFEHFLTPTGTFRHTDAILDWRAEGTPNDHNVRGLGAAGMRIWDFGWQQAVKGWGPGGIGRMRLLLHATDPASLERRIGRAASNGCIRIPTAMDRFLDAHGILDADYERVARRNVRFASLLLPDRTPTPLAGDRLVVIDSAQTAAAPASESAAQAQAPAHDSRPDVRPAAKKAAARSGKRHHVAGTRHRHGRTTLATR